jgi:hypothetical protein
VATLVSDIINAAFEDLGVIRPGESVSSAIQTSAFNLLNQRWASTSLERLMNNTVVHQTFTLTGGTSTYTLGTSGTLVATITPVRVISWASVQSSGFRNGGECISHETFAKQIKDPLAATSVLASAVAADNAYPVINLRIFPVPASFPASLILDYYGRLTAFTAVSDSLAGLAPGYEEFLRSDLAIAMYPRYARTGAMSLQSLQANAMQARKNIMELNASIAGLMPQQQQDTGATA